MRILLLPAVSLAIVGACATDDSVDTVAQCDQAAETLLTCGRSFDQSPFGTCQPDQHEIARHVLDVYAEQGCPGLVDVKADSPVCGILPFLCASHTARELDPFSTDGCSMFPDGTHAERNKWQQCCIAHDFAYYRGGASELKDAADIQLGACVTAASGSSLLGNLMAYGVQVGGSPVLPTPWRWGYGWNYDPFNGYRDLPADQAKAALAELDRYRANPWAPNALEQRLESLWDWIFGVPGLSSSIEDVNTAVAELP